MLGMDEVGSQCEVSGSAGSLPDVFNSAAFLLLGELSVGNEENNICVCDQSN